MARIAVGLLLGAGAPLIWLACRSHVCPGLFIGLAATALGVVRHMRAGRALEILIDHEESGQGWFWETDSQGAITYLSSTVAATLGKGGQALIGQPIGRLFRADAAPFDRIKIDQNVVRGAAVADSRNGAIMATIIGLAEILGMKTTAEGVETLDELDLVRALGCSHVQGFIYERPLDPAAVCARLGSDLVLEADGPWRGGFAQRPTALRKVVIEHDDRSHYATIRNVSPKGAMIEGLWNVPTGAAIGIRMTDGSVASALSRWCRDGRTGVEFAAPFRSEGAMDGEHRDARGETDEYSLPTSQVKSAATRHG